MENLINLLTSDELKLISKKHFNAGEIISREGEECSSIGILLSGKIRIISYSFEGDEIVFNSLKENDIYGNNLLFSSDNKYKGNVEAIVDSTVCFIFKDNLLKILQNNQKFLLAYLAYQSEFGKNLNSVIKLLSFDSAEERFLFYLHQHHNKISYKSISDLATTIHLKRETLSRLITKLEKKHIIRRASKEISLIKD